MASHDGPVDPATPTEVASSDTLPSPPTMPSSRGELAGYELGALLGQGGMGEVVIARDPRMERDVALKRMRAPHPSAELVERFLREAKIQARLDHPAIVPVHELGYDSDGTPYFTMKRVTGTTLAELLDANTEPPKRLLRAFVDVCLAVQLAHSRRVVHRDLKPANIMLGDYGEVYVLDWGVARVLVERHSTSRQDSEIQSLDGETKAGALLGTPGYMAPEQARGEPAETPADVYALGAILFELLAGESLHPRGMAALATTLSSGDLSPRRRRPDRPIAPELDELCVAALAAAPDSRPTARQLGDLIQRYLDGDRDVELRRTIATDELALARAALASRDPARRADAVHSAGRALAFDPGSNDAAELVTSLLVEPPEMLPAELTTAVEAAEDRLMRERSRRAIIPYAAVFLCLPWFAFARVVSWMPLIAVSVALAGVITAAWMNWRVRRVPAGIFLATQLVVVLAVSRIHGSLLLTPTLIVGILLAVTAFPWVNDRRWVVLAWTTAAGAGPLLLEAIGVLAPTWKRTEGGILTWGTILDTHDLASQAMIVAGSVAMVIGIAMYARTVNRDRRVAQRQLHIQAWHLQQLIPRRARPPASAAVAT